MQPGDWIKPAELYDYFMLNHPGGFSDPLVYHRWIEMVTALERLDAEPKSTEIGLLKTIGLLNMIGAQRGLKASDELLFLIYGAAYENAINRLITASAINYRIFNKEYRIWQGTDFNLSEKVSLASSEFEQLSLADTLNNLAPFKPIVARRATIETGSLRSFQPLFTSQNGTVRAKDGLGKPRIVFYLCEANEEITNINTKNPYDILAVCTLTEHLREAVIALLALQSLPKSYAALQHDPVAEREYREWLQHAQTETDKLLRSLLEEPETLTWKTQNEIWPVRNRRELQERLSAWMTNACYTQAPLIRNELINWDKPSASANSGRKRLINAMLNAADQPNLGIEKTPAEMSLYLSLLKATGLHRKQEDRWGFYTPRVTNPDNEDLNNKSDPYLLSPLFEAITECLTTATNKVVELTQIYQKLTQPPYGIKLGVLPIFIVAYLQTNRREVALYQEGIFCDAIGDAQAEMLCRRPEYFALERFELTGLRGELFNQYMSAIVGKLPDESTLLDIVKPLIRFINSLPYYSLNSKSISSEANQVRIAFAAAQSPGTLLFETLPLACGIAPETFKAGESEAVTQFIERLVAVLRELKNCYPQLLNHLTQQISQALLDKNIIDLAHLRQPLIDNYQDLHNYTPDKIGLGAFIKRLTDQNFQTDQAWLESVATLLAQKPAQKWTDENRIQAEVRLKALGQQLRDLEKLRLAVPQANDRPGKAMLIKVLDSERGEISRVVQMPEAEQQIVTVQANDIAQQLNKMTASQQLAVIATLFERYTNSVTKEISHD
jgi:hypothetical protein